MPDLDWSSILAPALDEVSNGVTVADASDPKRPLVFVNRAFERITGYSSEESLGRNCSFLQGKDSDEATVDRIRAALNNNERCHVVLRNYRRDGSGFLNELKLFPVPEGTDSPTHFIGVQNDVTAQFVALALQRRIQVPSQMLQQVHTLTGPSLNLTLDIDDLHLGLESVGLIVASGRGQILHCDAIAEALLSSSGKTASQDSLFDSFESSGLVDAFRPSRKPSPKWITARVRDTEPQAAVLLRAHRAALPDLSTEMMIVLVKGVSD